MKALRAIPLLLLLALSACGSDDVVKPVAQASTPEATADAGVTEGRTGAATTNRSGGEETTLARGGAIKPRSAKPTPRQRAGVGAGASCADADLLPDAENLDRVQAAILCLLNGERTDRGLGALAPNAQLAEAAQGHAQDMVAQRYFAHDSPDGRSMTDRVRASGYLSGSDDWVIGENLAWASGSLASPRAIMNAWMNSEGHRRNILEPRFKEIGMGAATGTPSGASTGATYAHEFGARNDAPAAASGETKSAAPAAHIPTRRELSRRRRACRRLDRPRRVRACKARVARQARAARAARRNR